MYVLWRMFELVQRFPCVLVMNIYFGHWKQSWLNICEEAETKTGLILSNPMYLIFIKHTKHKKKKKLSKCCTVHEK